MTATAEHRAWVQSADRLARPLESRSAEIESAREMPADIADALAEVGLYGLLTPRAYGGGEVHAATYFEVVERLARSDAAVGWCCFISCTAGVVAAYLPEADAARLFDKPALKLAGVLAPRGRAVAASAGGVAGWRVSGRWAWGSGLVNADLVGGGCVVIGADGEPETLARGAPRVISVLFDRHQVRALDNWSGFGLCGTGSGEFEADEVFVPAGRAASVFGMPVQPGPLYRIPVYGLLALGVAAVASGIARRAADEFAALAAIRIPQGSSKPLAQRPLVQDAVARAEAALRSARAFMLEAVNTAWAAAVRDGEIAVASRRDLRLAATHLAHTASETTTRLYTLAGGSAVFADSPLQRCLRDVHVATQHMVVADPTWELTGRLLLGQPTPPAML